MTRRITKAESSLLFLLIIIGVPIFLIVKFFEMFGFLVPVIAIVGIVVAILVFRAVARKNHHSDLMAKYGDPQVVSMIVSKTIWAGETSEQLADSLGRPADIDEKVLKTKKRRFGNTHTEVGIAMASGLR